MRVNIYNEELTDDVEVVSTTAENTGIVYFGVRCYLKSSQDLHNNELDDDRSAVTFWLGDRVKCEGMAALLGGHLGLTDA